MGVYGKRSAARGGSVVVSYAEIEDRGVDVELDGGPFTFELDDLVGAGEGVDGGAEDVVGGVAIEIAAGLDEGDKLRSGLEGVEDEDAVLDGKSEVGGDLRGECGAIGFLFEEFGVEDGGLGGFRAVGCGGGVASLPAVRGFEVDEGGRELFLGSTTLCADVVDDVTFYAVAHDDLIATVLEEETGAVGRDGDVRGEGFLGGGAEG